MDYEKKYKEALKLAIDYHKANEILGNCDENNVLENIFPELKESEDEKISREITEFILTHRIDEPNDIEDTNPWLIWLEKQGKEKQSLRERYKNIAESEWFKRTHEGMSVSDDNNNSRWTEEDERGSDETIELLEYFNNYAPEFRRPAIKRSINWLKSLKQRMEEQ